MSTCPRCHSPLKDADYEGVRVATCAGCDGHWMGAEQLKQIVDTRENLWEAEALEAWREMPAHRVPLHRESGALGCPACGEPMEAYNYAADTGIILDRCRRCGGIWLDGGELDKVQMAVEASEMDVEQDRKRFSGKLHEVEVFEDRQEQKDVRTSRAPWLTAIISR